MAGCWERVRSQPRAPPNPSGLAADSIAVRCQEGGGGRGGPKQSRPCPPCLLAPTPLPLVTYSAPPINEFRRSSVNGDLRCNRRSLHRSCIGESPRTATQGPANGARLCMEPRIAPQGPAKPVIGATGFEPATFRPPVECATKLRHAPVMTHDSAPSSCLSGCFTGPSARAQWSSTGSFGRCPFFESHPNRAHRPLVLPSTQAGNMCSY